MQDIIRKIQKCLRLSESANEHEAAAAMRQARRLMQAHNISESELSQAERKATKLPSGDRAKFRKWEATLANVVANSFGVYVVLHKAYKQEDLGFYGKEQSVTVAMYAFEVCRSAAKRACDAYAKANLTNTSTSERAFARRMFLVNFVAGLYSELKKMGQQEQREAGSGTDLVALDEQEIQASKEFALAQIGGKVTAARSRESRRMTAAEANAAYAGREMGKQTRLHQGVGSKDGKAPLMLN